MDLSHLMQGCFLRQATCPISHVELGCNSLVFFFTFNKSSERLTASADAEITGRVDKRLYRSLERCIDKLEACASTDDGASALLSKMSMVIVSNRAR
jgi:hypothetical protein